MDGEAKLSLGRSVCIDEGGCKWSEQNVVQLMCQSVSGPLANPLFKRQQQKTHTLGGEQSFVG